MSSTKTPLHISQMNGFPIPKANLDFFFSSINSFNQFSSLHVTFLLTLTLTIALCNCVRFPFQLSETSYKLKGSLPYQVSLSILGNKHNKDNRVSKKKKNSPGFNVLISSLSACCLFHCSAQLSDKILNY